MGVILSLVRSGQCAESMTFPVSIKGVLLESDGVVLLENDRAEWELPGGRLEQGETPQECLAREMAEELGCTVDVGPLLDCWVYEVLPRRTVLIVHTGLRVATRATSKSAMSTRLSASFPWSRSPNWPCRMGISAPG